MSITHDDDPGHCPDSPDQHHAPDWDTCSVDADDHGNDVTIDVACRYCGRLACVGTAETLAPLIDW